MEINSLLDLTGNQEGFGDLRKHSEMEGGQSQMVLCLRLNET